MVDDGCYARDVAIVAYWNINSSIVKLSVIGCIILKHVPDWLIWFIYQSNLSGVFSHTYVRTFLLSP